MGQQNWTFNFSYLSKTLELITASPGPWIIWSAPCHSVTLHGSPFHWNGPANLLSDICSAVDQSQLALLALLDVCCLLPRYFIATLWDFCGIRGPPLVWLRSYLTGHTQMVICGDSKTPWVMVKFTFFTRLILFSKHLSTGTFMRMICRPLSMDTIVSVCSYWSHWCSLLRPSLLDVLQSAFTELIKDLPDLVWYPKALLANTFPPSLPVSVT